jgi:Predicted helicase
MNHRVYQNAKLFPTPKHNNLVICISGIGASKDFSVLISNCIPDLQLLFNGQCFPLYWYDDSDSDIVDLFSQGTTSEMDRYQRKDAVSDWILSTARKHMEIRLTKKIYSIMFMVYFIV